MKRIIILSLASIVLFGCVFSAGCVTDDNSQHLAEFGYTGGEQSISAKVGDVITISANTNPSTGYSWTEPEVSEGLKILGIGSYAEYNPELIGAGGIRYWDVTAEEAGTYTFTAEYMRPWEGEAIGKIEVTITFR